jgi:hypothetical protein
VGQDSFANSLSSAAFGQAAVAINTNALAVGANSVASGANSMAVGQNASAAGNGATAVGQNANARYNNSAAFGNNANVVGENQQMFGTTTNRYTMPGITTASSTVHQVGPKSLVTSDGNGNLAADQGLYDQIGQNQQGVAMAMALGDFWVPENKKFAVGLNASTFDGVWAMAANVGGELYDGVHVTGGIAVSESGMVAGRVGSVMSG